MTTLGQWEGSIVKVTIGATPADGGTRRATCTVGGDRDLPLLGEPGNLSTIPKIAFDVCDDPALWPEVLRLTMGDELGDPAAMAARAEREMGADLVRLNLTSTRRKGFSDFSAIRKTIEDVLSATGLP